jgi:hypothetical protein
MKTLIILSILMFVGGSQALNLLPGDTEAEQIFATDVWMLCDAFGKLLMSIVVMLAVGKKDQWLYFLSLLLITLAANAVVDEVWGNPVSFELHEVIFVLLGALLSLKIARV